MLCRGEVLLIQVSIAEIAKATQIYNAIRDGFLTQELMVDTDHYLLLAVRSEFEAAKAWKMARRFVIASRCKNDRIGVG